MSTESVFELLSGGRLGSYQKDSSVVSSVVSSAPFECSVRGRFRGLFRGALSSALLRAPFRADDRDLDSRRILEDFVRENRLRESRYLRQRCGHEPLEPLGDPLWPGGAAVTNHRTTRTNTRDPRGGHWGKRHKGDTNRYVRRSTRQSLDPNRDTRRGALTPPEAR